MFLLTRVSRDEMVDGLRVMMEGRVIFFYQKGDFSTDSRRMISPSVQQMIDYLDEMRAKYKDPRNIVYGLKVTCENVGGVESHIIKFLLTKENDDDDELF